MATFVLLIAAALSTTPWLGAQSPPASVAFEVASIRPHKGHVTTVGVSISGPRVRVAAYSLTNLIGDAYHRQRYQISGAQGWMDAQRYDILANAPGESAPTSENLKLMLQALLADRFHLNIHTETRESPVYALVVGKSGSKLKEGTADEATCRYRMANQHD